MIALEWDKEGETLCILLVRKKNNYVKGRIELCDAMVGFHIKYTKLIRFRFS